MAEIDLPNANAALATLLRERLGIRRGETLEAKLAHAGRLVPRSERAAGRRLVEAERLWPHPRLRRQVNPADLANAETRLRGWLEGIDPADRRKGMILGVLASLAFNFLLLLAAVTGWAWYAGWL